MPGDKSISHRALMFAALAEGESHITHFLNGSDCLATLKLIRQLGVQAEVKTPTEVVIFGKGARGLQEPNDILDCENSGTTIRLLTGLLAGQNFFSVLSGSEQIRRRPMGRVVKPLQAMGAQISGRSHDLLAPLAIRPASKLMGQTLGLEVASAQIKSCLLLAGLFAEGTTTIVEPGPARDHTERLLRGMGANVQAQGNRVSVTPLSTPLAPLKLRVPGDMSSAAFLLVAATIVPGSEIELTHVGINPTRDGIVEALQAMGASIEIYNQRETFGEPVADLRVRSANLKGQTFGGDLVVRMIDELPILALAATQAQGVTHIKDATELKVKETNRIDTTANELRALGANIEATADGLIIEGPTPLRGAAFSSHGDHRLAMVGAVAGLLAQGTTTVLEADVTKDSFPGFEQMLRQLGAEVNES